MTQRKAADKSKKELRNATSFLQAHGLGLPALRARLSALDWQADNALARASAELALFVGTIAELLKADARAHRQTFSDRFSTLLVAAPLDERGLMALALAALEADAPLPGINATHRRVLATQPLPAHQRLLRDGTLPASRIADIADVDTEALLPLYARQLSGNGVTLKLLQFAIAADGLPRGALIRRLRRAQSLMREQPAFQALDYASFRKLPATARAALLFTPALCAFFLTAEAQAAARPPSPDFDPLFIEHALGELQRGRLSHVDLDTLFLTAQTPALQTRIVTALAEGRGEMQCDDDVIERLLAGSTAPAFCLIACAAARDVHDAQRALAQLPGLPHSGVLGEALHRFAQIAWCDGSPVELPAALRADTTLTQGIMADCCAQLLLALNGEATRLPAAAIFRQFTAWVHHDEQRNTSPPASTRRKGNAASSSRAASLGAGLDIPLLAGQFSRTGARLAGEIDGHDLLALFLAGSNGETLAIALASALRKHNHARWLHGFFTRIADINAAVALALIGEQPDDDETAVLGQAEAVQPEHAGAISNAQRNTRRNSGTTPAPPNLNTAKS